MAVADETLPVVFFTAAKSKIDWLAGRPAQTNAAATADNAVEARCGTVGEGLLDAIVVAETTGDAGSVEPGPEACARVVTAALCATSPITTGVATADVVAGLAILGVAALGANIAGEPTVRLEPLGKAVELVTMSVPAETTVPPA
jgi:hypothetical protein